jgi:hypothetical protein
MSDGNDMRPVAQRGITPGEPLIVLEKLLESSRLENRGRRTPVVTLAKVSTITPRAPSVLILTSALPGE